MSDYYVFHFLIFPYLCWLNQYNCFKTHGYRLQFPVSTGSLEDPIERLERMDFRTGLVPDVDTLDWSGHIGTDCVVEVERKC